MMYSIQKNKSNKNTMRLVNTKALVAVRRRVSTPRAAAVKSHEARDVL